jgi:hypothetical protein
MGNAKHFVNADFDMGVSGIVIDAEGDETKVEGNEEVDRCWIQMSNVTMQARQADQVSRQTTVSG